MSTGNAFTGNGYGDLSPNWPAVFRAEKIKAAVAETKIKRTKTIQVRQHVPEAPKPKRVPVKAVKAPKPRTSQQDPNSVTGRMRAALASGPMTRVQLAKLVGVEPTDVYGLMKYDVKHKRVIFTMDGHRSVFSLPSALGRQGA